MPRTKKNVKKLFVMDCETGGLNPKENSILTFAAVVCEFETGKVLAKLDLKVKHDTYNVTARAMEVNGIDLVKHHKDATPAEECVGKIIDFVNKHFPKQRVPPAGQNTRFDIDFVRALFESVGGDYDKFFDHRYHDTMPILRFLSELGIVPASACSLDGARKHFGISAKGAHTALKDCEHTAQLFAAIINFVTETEEVEEVEEEVEEVKEKVKPKRGRRSKKSKKVEPEPEPEEEEESEEEEVDEEEEEEDVPEELEEEGEGDEEEDESEEDFEFDEEDDEDLNDWDDDED